MNNNKAMIDIVESIRSEKYPEVDAELVQKLLEIHKKYSSDPEKMKRETKRMIDQYIDGDTIA